MPHSNGAAIRGYRVYALDVASLAQYSSDHPAMTVYVNATIDHLQTARNYTLTVAAFNSIGSSSNASVSGGAVHTTRSVPMQGYAVTKTTPLPGLYRCGDSTTAGIGVPAVASSGAQCANALLSVFEQMEMNKLIKM